MKCILGKKIEMTHVFKEDGTVVPVTLVQAGPCVVTAVKTNETDGYTAVQMGFGTKRHAAKAQLGQWGDHGVFQFVREFRDGDTTAFTVGQTLDASSFAPGDVIHVVGTSKGRGFQGVVKRHGFGGQESTHGTKDQVRMPGSLGAKGPARVFKGTRMGGRMGNDRVTVKNLEVVEVRAKEGILAIKGAIPGSRNGLVMIQTA